MMTSIALAFQKALPGSISLPLELEIRVRVAMAPAPMPKAKKKASDGFLEFLASVPCS
jgi:hypothetical protein